MNKIQTKSSPELIAYLRTFFTGRNGNGWSGKYLTFYPESKTIQGLEFQYYTFVSQGIFIDTILESQKQKFLPFEIAGHKVAIEKDKIAVGCKTVLLSDLQALKSAVAQWKETLPQKDIYTESSPELRAYLRSVNTKAECCLKPHSDREYNYIRLNSNGSFEGSPYIGEAEHVTIGQFIDAVISYKPHELAMSGVVPNCVVKIDADGLLITERDNEAGYRVTFEEFDRLLVAIKA